MRVAIIGNSGSGKSTLASKLANGNATPILDLDTLVWEPNRTAIARDPISVLAELERFCGSHCEWIIEGCYAHCIQAILCHGPQLIFLEPGKEVCLGNCRTRAWEPHKYASKHEQDAMLEFLLDWVGEYYRRDDDMSLQAHQTLFDEYRGPKQLVKATPAQAFVPRAVHARQPTQ
jgi:adenylate kinase family enzyme